MVKVKEKLLKVWRNVGDFTTTNKMNHSVAASTWRNALKRYGKTKFAVVHMRVKETTDIIGYNITVLDPCIRVKI